MGSKCAATVLKNFCKSNLKKQAQLEANNIKITLPNNLKYGTRNKIRAEIFYR